MTVRLNRQQADLVRILGRGQVEGDSCGDFDDMVCFEEDNRDVVLSLLQLCCVRLGPRNQVILTNIGEEYYGGLFR